LGTDGSWKHRLLTPRRCMLETIESFDWGQKGEMREIAYSS